VSGMIARQALAAALAFVLGAAAAQAQDPPPDPPQETDRPATRRLGPAERFSPLPEGVVVQPETPTVVEMSSTDVNRVSCPVAITDVVYSAEKGVTVRFIDREAFVKFLVTRKGAEVAYATNPTELYVVCGGSVYTLIAQPRKIPPAPIRLAPSKVSSVEENRQRLGSLPGEAKLIRILREVATGEIPASYLVRPIRRRVELSADLEVVLHRLIEIEGEGLQVKELRVTAKPSAGPGAVRLREPVFATNALGPERKAAVAIEKTDLGPGEETRVIVVELRQGG